MSGIMAKHPKRSRSHQASIFPKQLRPESTSWAKQPTTVQPTPYQKPYPRLLRWSGKILRYLQLFVVAIVAISLLAILTNGSSLLAPLGELAWKIVWRLALLASGLFIAAAVLESNSKDS
jgi:hypothetical protein